MRRLPAVVSLASTTAGGMEERRQSRPWASRGLTGSSDRRKLSLMAEPLVSIVTPVHNGAEHLAECIESVVGQTYSNWEYVVVDNCSSDRTPDIVTSFARSEPRIRYQRFEDFVDVIPSYNRAFAAIGVDSRYCKVVGADDLLYPECVERMVAVAEAHPTVGLVSARRRRGELVDLTGMPDGEAVLPGRVILRQSLLCSVSVIGSATSLLFRSELMRGREPFFDMSFRHADTEAAYWALSQSDFGHVPEILTFTRLSVAGQGARSVGLNSHRADRVRMLLRYGPTTLSAQEYRRQLRYELRQYVWWLFKQRLKPSRRHDGTLSAFHRCVVDRMSAEAGTDPDVRRAAAVIPYLLPGGH